MKKILERTDLVHERREKSDERGDGMSCMDCMGCMDCMDCMDGMDCMD